MQKLSKGKFIVIEGLDGSGKSTQTKLLAEYLKKNGYEVVKIDFPQHGLPSSYLVDEYLRGKYGAAETVGPYRASIFYAIDRYDASFKIRQWLNQGKAVIADRYLTSNIGHQGGKINNKSERSEYVNWLYDLEYRILGIPKPDITIILKTNPDITLKLAHKITDREKLSKRKAYLGDKKRDIHEKDKKHLVNALKSYLWAAKEFPKDFKVVECVKEGKLLPPNEIAKMVVKTLQPVLKK